MFTTLSETIMGFICKAENGWDKKQRIFLAIVSVWKT